MRYRMVRTEALTKIYANHRGIEDISLEVEPGEVFGLLGTLGAGKTTLIHLLLGLTRPTRGSALIFGMDINRHRKRIRSRCGFLPGSSLRSLLAGVNLPSQDHLPLNNPFASELAERFKVQLGVPSHRLSALDRKKRRLVKLFAHQPDLLILEDPFRGLAVEDQDELYRLIGETRRTGQTVLFSSTTLSEVERICDHVALLHKGHLLKVERGVTLRTRALRRVEMRFAHPVAAEPFTNLPNLSRLQIEGNRLRCMLSGTPEALIQAASPFRILDFISQQPPLEEVLHFYYRDMLPLSA